METERLILRDWRDSDLVPFAELNADPEVMEFFPAPLASSESDELAARIRSHLETEGWGLWAVSEKEGEPFLGFVGLNTVPPELPFAPAVEVGWRLKRSAWGKGYATEAAAQALCYGFTVLKLTEIVSFTTKQNVRSTRVMERLGMHRDSEFLNPRLPEGHPLRPHVLYRLKAQEWVPADGSPPAQRQARCK